jgi:small GTP-binding protein
VAASDDGRTAVSGATDGTIRFWRFTRGECAAAFYAHEGTVSDVAISSDATVAISAGVEDRELRIWSVPTSEVAAPPAEGTTRYTNAKVLLVGDTGVGKTGLALRLAENRFHATVSTDGVWATQLKLSHGATEDGVEREIWLWDFGGQADYRLIHQLFMDETALALLVFNPQIDDPFEGLNQWDRDLTRAARRSFKKLLIAGRCDRGGLTVSKASVDRFCAEKGYSGFFETSARTGSNCDHLRKKIIEAITWEEIPWRSSPRLFKQLKDAIIQLKDEGHLLLRAVELKQQIQLRAVEEEFSLKELRAVIALLAGPGVVWQLEFGDFVLLRPEIINSYAAAVIRSVRSHTDEIGCIEEERVLSGNLIYHDFKRLEKEEEQIILRAMHQLFIGRGLCLREQTEWGSQLIFPAYFKRERTDIGRHPANLVSYTFAGQAEDIYATLVVKLHHTPVFEKDQLWRFAADFKTQEGKRLGLKMAKCSDGSATITVYSEPSVSDDTKVTFIRYVHDHLKAKDPDVIRVRHYVCPNPKCGEGVEGARAVQKALEGGKKFIVCQFCNKKIPLTDLIERKFASMQLQRHVRDLGEKARISIDNESKELILVGHTLATVAEAGQIFRPTPNSDWGIDGEIEFKDESGNASGSRVYVQLKSGDSYLTVGRDRKEIFRIKNPRHVEYWTSQPCPVILVVRSSDGNTRWINISLALKMAKKKNKPLNKVVFEGIPFDVEHILQLREEMVPVKQP